ncbi:acyl-CoA thioesterase [Nocardia africana]|uniref:Thioesterase superfamily n=1 Tax=Nocardia africana TaxID=134964 RepID=A0A378WU91_9NOCA|nr:thioesterase family protein [Nocardia africana]MCC3313717.1 thioesterase family protein [Nocardia africana]SUA44900.1 Thioesterase superfamily [Nocardia africana]
MSAPSAWYTSIELRRADFDYLGHVSAAAYLALFEEARVRWLAGGAGHTEPSYVVAVQNIEYLREVRLADSPIRVSIRVEDLSTRRFAITEEMHAVDGELHARSRATLVGWDRAERRSRVLSEDELVLIRAAFVPTGIEWKDKTTE